MSSLSTILAEIEASAEKVKQLQTDLAAETEHRKMLVEQYSAQSSEALRALGIEIVRKRKARSQNTILLSSAARSFRHSLRSGEKNPKTILAAALEAAEKTAKTKLNLVELPAEIKAKIEERLKSTAPKK